MANNKDNKKIICPSSSSPEEQADSASDASDGGMEDQTQDFTPNDNQHNNEQSKLGGPILNIILLKDEMRPISESSFKDLVLPQEQTQSEADSTTKTVNDDNIMFVIQPETNDHLTSSSLSAQSPCHIKNENGAIEKTGLPRNQTSLSRPTKVPISLPPQKLTVNSASSKQRISDFVDQKAFNDDMNKYYDENVNKTQYPGQHVSSSSSRGSSSSLTENQSDRTKEELSGNHGSGGYDETRSLKTSETLQHNNSNTKLSANQSNCVSSLLQTYNTASNHVNKQDGSIERSDIGAPTDFNFDADSRSDSSTVNNQTAVCRSNTQNMAASEMSDPSNQKDCRDNFAYDDPSMSNNDYQGPVYMPVSQVEPNFDEYDQWDESAVEDLHSCGLTVGPHRLRNFNDANQARHTFHPSFPVYAFNYTNLGHSIHETPHLQQSQTAHNLSVSTDHPQRHPGQNHNREPMQRKRRPDYLSCGRECPINIDLSFHDLRRILYESRVMNGLEVGQSDFCLVCGTGTPNCILFPCGHGPCVCEQCACWMVENSEDCPVCRMTVKMFISDWQSFYHQE